MNATRARLALLPTLLMLLAPVYAAHSAPVSPHVWTADGPPTPLRIEPPPNIPATLGPTRAPPDPPEAPRADQGGANEPYGVDFKCPYQTGTSLDGQAAVDNSICPQYVIDMEGDILGQPVLAVDPLNPNIQAFHSLHGGKGLPEPLEAPPPTERSRYNVLHQPHTTFRTTDGGQEWEDHRYYAYDALNANGRTLYGEDNAIAIDAQGRGYLASLYSWHDQGESQYKWSVVAYKVQRFNRDVNYYENVVPLHYREADQLPNQISDLHLVHSPDANAVVLLWLEHKAEDGVSPSGRTSWVEAYRTRPGEGSQWEKIPASQHVGPCRAIAKPVAYGGLIYFGCLPDEGYAYGDAGARDRWQIHAIDAVTWTTRYVAPTPLVTQYARLVDMAQTGYFLLVGSGLEGGEPTVKVSRGALAANWTDPDEYGSKASPRDEDGGAQVHAARVTAAAYTKQTGYLHLIFMERYESAADPSNLANGDSRMFNKTYSVIRAVSGTFEGRFDLQFGQPVSGADTTPVYQGLDATIFDDLHDDIVVWIDPATGHQRIFTVFGDHGTGRYAEVVEENALPAIPLPPLNIAPIPLAAPASNAALNAAAAGVIMALMLLRLLQAKKRHTVKAPSM